MNWIAIWAHEYGVEAQATFMYYLQEE